MMMVSNLFYNSDENIAAVVLKNGEQYHFETNNTDDEFESISDLFINDYENTVNTYTAANNEERVEDFSEWVDLTHVYINLKSFRN